MATTSDNDWDSISLTSTVQSEQQETYIIDEIVAEMIEDGVNKYLAKWHDYPDVRNSWEPRENFDDATIKIWHDKKALIDERLEQAYDIASWEATVAFWQDEAERRKERRRAKRLRLGILVESSIPEGTPPPDHDFEQASETDSLYEEANDEPPALRNSPTSIGKSRLHVTLPCSERSDKDTIPLVNRRHTRTRSASNTASPSTPKENPLASSDDDVPLHLKRNQRTKISSLLDGDQGDSGGGAASGDIEMLDCDGHSSAGDSLMEEFHHETFGAAMETRKKNATPAAAHTPHLSQAESTSTRGSEVSEIVTKRREPLNQGTERKEAVERNSTAPKAGRNSSVSVPAPKVKRPSISTTSLTKVSLNENAKAKFTSTGVVGRGPTRLPTDTKLNLASTPTTNMYGSLKGRKRGQSSSGAGANARASEKQARFSTFGQRRKFEKAGRNERAPDLKDLILHDPKKSRVVRNKLDNLPDDGLQQEVSHQPMQEEKDLKTSAVVLSPTNSSRFAEEQVENISEVTGVAQRVQNRRTTSDVIQSPAKLQPANVSHDSADSALHIFTDTGRFASTVGGTVSLNSAEASHPTGNHDEPLFGENYTKSLVGVETVQPEPLHRRENSNTAGGSLQSLSQEGQLRQPKDHAMSVSAFRPSKYEAEARPRSINNIEGDFNNEYRSLLVAQRGVVTYDKISSDVLGTILIGQEKARIGTGLFRGLTKLQRDLMLTCRGSTKFFQVHFQQICTAKDYEVYFHNDSPIYFAASHVVPGTGHNEKFLSLANTLVLHDAGAIFVASRYVMLLYPTGTDRWHFLDQCYPEKTSLAPFRFVLRVPIPDLTSSMVPGPLRSPSPPVAGENGVTALMRGLFGLEYSKLLPQVEGKDKKPLSTFFLIWPETSGKGEYDLLNEFLNKHGAITYSSKTHGSWDHFVNVKKVDPATVLIHGSFLDLHRIPQLSTVLKKSIVLFHINLLSSPGEPHLTRLFPHGGAICLTDSVILTTPVEAIRILSWFERNILQYKPPGTWKLAMRPRFYEWILDIAQDRSYEEAKPYLQIYAKLWNILIKRHEDDDFSIPLEELEIVSPCELNNFDLEVGIGDKKDNAELIAKNDAKLVDWFAGWARTKVEYMRRFTVVHGTAGEAGSAKRNQWRSEWGHLNVCSVVGFMPEYKLPPLETNHENAEEGKKEEKKERKPSETSREIVRGSA